MKNKNWQEKIGSQIQKSGIYYKVRKQSFLFRHKI